jgi:hypothetical protein
MLQYLLIYAIHVQIIFEFPYPIGISFMRGQVKAVKVLFSALVYFGLLVDILSKFTPTQYEL